MEAISTVKMTLDIYNFITDARGGHMRINDAQHFISFHHLLYGNMEMTIYVEFSWRIVFYTTT